MKTQVIFHVVQVGSYWLSHKISEEIIVIRMVTLILRVKPGKVYSTRRHYCGEKNTRGSNSVNDVSTRGNHFWNTRGKSAIFVDLDFERKFE